MSIVRAVIYFQLLHLIVGLSVDHCDDLGYAKQCLINVSSTNTQLSVQCRIRRLEIKSLDSNIGKAFDENKIPSQPRLWHMCMHHHNGTNFNEQEISFHRIEWSNVGITQFPDDYFCDGQFIFSISIANSRLNDTRKLGFSSRDECDIPCTRLLSSFEASNNAFEKVFNNSFSGLERLGSLELNNNRIKELERDAFINLKSLLSLQLKNNSISVLPPGVFRQQHNTIEFLFLSDNRLNSKSIIELKNLERLRYLFLKTNRIDVLPNDVFNHMTRLVELHLGDNLIKTLQGSLTNLRNLEYLFLTANDISVILSEDFQNVIQLKWVHFSNNPITTVEHDFCANCRIENVTIAHATLTTVPKFISKSTQLKALDLSNSKIDQINVGAFDAGEDIKIINLSFNQLTDITNVFSNCTVKRLKLDHNRLTKLSFTDFSFNLMNLSITHNNIHTIDTYDIIPHTFWFLKTLNLSHNNLNEIADGSFDHLTMLKVLNLEHNNLRHISEKVLKKLRSLTQLFLSHNKIKIIEPNAFPSQLQTLHLDNNRLVDFNIWELDNLANLTQISVHSNRWSCESNLSERLEEWLLKKSRIVEDICQLVCEQPNGTLHPLYNSSQCPETTSINVDELNSANEINYANGVVYANVWVWLLALCVCIAMCV